MKKRKNEKYFKNKKITLMGLGLLGRGIGDAVFLAENDAKLIITDLKTKDQLKLSLKKLEKYKNIKYSLGAHKNEDFKKADIILKGNGVHFKNKYIDIAKKNNIQIEKSLPWAISILKDENVDFKIIGITGTKGKSTVTAMIESVFDEIKKNNKNVKFHMAGNIKGLSAMDILNKIKDGDYLIAELDSWILQGFGDHKISPNFVIFTNFFEDHLNYYDSMQQYFNDKKNIFQYQNENDIFISLEENIKTLSKYYNIDKINSKRFFLNKLEKIEGNFKFFGEHNYKNALMVKKLCLELGFKEEYIINGLEKFKPVEGRMQVLGEKKGVLFINDNNSTTPKSTIASINAISNKYKNKKIYMIAGGTDKGFNYEKITKKIERKIEQVFLYEASGSKKMVKKFSENFKNFKIIDYTKDAEKELKKIVKKNDIILFSPACSSFGKQFDNEYQRGEQFVDVFNNW